MKALRLSVWSAALVMAAGMTSSAMGQATRPSPPGIAAGVGDGARVIIYYSRPFTKDPKTGEARKIWGTLVPFDKVWRTGANEATLMVVQKDIEIGGKAVPAGAYTLYSIPKEDGATLIINKQIGQLGTEYKEDQDLARVEMKKETPEKKADQFTMQVARNTGEGGGGVIRMMWEDVAYSVPFKAKK